eukprot:gb/GECG01015246.1/.p1 GENE.gb/GECG01015246.1/~~gb/GECG01015246.1/.p1  ORF type:complete len:281 (+),score=56.43 gb/GECG01015246.1/:1-843(+)
MHLCLYALFCRRATEGNIRGIKMEEEESVSSIREDHHFQTGRNESYNKPQTASQSFTSRDEDEVEEEDETYSFTFEEQQEGSEYSSFNREEEEEETATRSSLDSSQRPIRSSRSRRDKNTEHEEEASRYRRRKHREYTDEEESMAMKRQVPNGELRQKVYKTLAKDGVIQKATALMREHVIRALYKGGKNGVSKQKLDGTTTDPTDSNGTSTEMTLLSDGLVLEHLVRKQYSSSASVFEAEAVKGCTTLADNRAAIRRQLGIPNEVMMIIHICPCLRICY